MDLSSIHMQAQASKTYNMQKVYGIFCNVSNDSFPFFVVNLQSPTNQTPYFYAATISG